MTSYRFFKIWRGFQNFPKLRDPHTTYFDIILHFSLVLLLLVVNLHAKFEVSSSSRPPRYGRVPKIRKVGHVTPSQPILT